MKKLFQLMLAAILTLSGTLAGLTSCSDNEDNATPQKSVVGDLEGQWCRW